MPSYASGANTSSTSNEDKGLEPPVEKDDDPDGTKALATKEPLEQAWKYLKPIAVKSCRRTDVWCVAYDVAVRRSAFRLIFDVWAHPGDVPQTDADGYNGQRNTYRRRERCSRAMTLIREIRNYMFE